MAPETSVCVPADTAIQPTVSVSVPTEGRRKILLRFEKSDVVRVTGYLRIVKTSSLFSIP